MKPTDAPRDTSQPVPSAPGPGNRPRFPGARRRLPLPRKKRGILLGYPGTTQDVDVFPRRSAENGRRIVNLRNIIASKRASGRQKDLVDLPLLESFRVEFEKRHAPPLRSAAETAADRPKTASASPKLSPEL